MTERHRVVIYVQCRTKWVRLAETHRYDRSALARAIHRIIGDLIARLADPLHDRTQFHQTTETTRRHRLCGTLIGSSVSVTGLGVPRGPWDGDDDPGPNGGGSRACNTGESVVFWLLCPGACVVVRGPNADLVDAAELQIAPPAQSIDADFGNNMMNDFEVASIHLFNTLFENVESITQPNNEIRQVFCATDNSTENGYYLIQATKNSYLVPENPILSRSISNCEFERLIVGILDIKSNLTDRMRFHSTFRSYCDSAEFSCSSKIMRTSSINLTGRTNEFVRKSAWSELAVTEPVINGDGDRWCPADAELTDTAMSASVPQNVAGQDRAMTLGSWDDSAPGQQPRPAGQGTLASGLAGDTARRSDCGAPGGLPDRILMPRDLGRSQVASQQLASIEGAFGRPDGHGSLDSPTAASDTPRALPAWMIAGLPSTTRSPCMT